MAWVAKDYIGEWIFNCKPDMWAGDCIEHNYWLPQDRYGAYGFQLPQGSIKKLIGRELSCVRWGEVINGVYTFKEKIVMAIYRIVDMYRKSKAVRGIHYDSWNEQILAYRVDKRHSLLFGLIHYWDYGACNLRPEYLFPSVDKAKEAILKVNKSKRITILYE